MSKLRSDSKWNGLSAEQRETLEGWLFEEKISYREALERAKTEFGITASFRSLAFFYQRLARERMQGELEETLALAKDVEGSPANWDDLAAAAQTLLAKRMVQLAVESPDNVRELVSLGRILVATEAQDVRRRRIEIAERRWEAEERGPVYRARRARMLREAMEREMAGNPVAESEPDEDADDPED